MKTTEQMEKFIELRAKNYSFDKIAEELGIHKTTLISWTDKFQVEIANMRAIERDSLQKKYLMTKEAKIETFGEILINIKNELLERDFSEIDTKDLIDMSIKISNILESENKGICFIVEQEEDDFLKKMEDIDKYKTIYA